MMALHDWLVNLALKILIVANAIGGRRLPSSMSKGHWRPEAQFFEVCSKEPLILYTVVSHEGDECAALPSLAVGLRHRAHWQAAYERLAN